MRHTVILLLMNVALAGSIHTLELSTPYPPDWEVTPQDILDAFGPPELAMSNLMTYVVSYADLQADVTCWMSGGTLERMSMAFDLADADVSSLRRAFTRVGKRLRLTYGVPDMITRSRFDYETHIWYLPGGEMRHQVIYTGGRAEHSLESIHIRNP
ncbi:MAG: hypothetical protein E4H09_04195 [Spirochaetales bacterium]|nr:MAG: hypothetical protein E4H09_04195 [Spirochaetales bacterium]